MSKLHQFVVDAQESPHVCRTGFHFDTACIDAFAVVGLATIRDVCNERVEASSPIVTDFHSHTRWVWSGVCCQPGRFCFVTASAQLLRHLQHLALLSCLADSTEANSQLLGLAGRL